MKKIAVYCGASAKVDPSFMEAAEGIGRLLARRGIGVVYGGAKIGMMGAVAEGALAEGGEVIGVIPELFGTKLAHEGLNELRVTATMHERKQLMFDLADAVIALPGGFGTLEETLEVITWARLGMHTKPTGLLNHRGYYDRLLAFLDHMQEEGFCAAEDRALLVSEADPHALLGAMQAYRAPTFDRPWLRA